MSDLQETEWWAEFVLRLADEPLALLASELDVSSEALEEALAQVDDGEAITATPAWPEIVRRIRDGASIRHTARRFQTSPRRIRRGLARTAVRVGGMDVADSGHPALKEVAGELGSVPDGVLARQCGVTVEAVQGERRRLGIEAFRPAASPERSAARRKGLKPAPAKRPKSQKVWQQDEVSTQVVHRSAKRRVFGPGSGATPAPVAGFAKGLRLPTPKTKASPASTGERAWSMPPPTEPREDDAKHRQGTRPRVRRRVVRTEADPIATALGRTSKAVETSDAAPRSKERAVRRRRVARRSTSQDSERSDPSSLGLARPQAVSAPVDGGVPERANPSPSQPTRRLGEPMEQPLAVVAPSQAVHGLWSHVSITVGAVVDGMSVSSGVKENDRPGKDGERPVAPTAAGASRARGQMGTCSKQGAPDGSPDAASGLPGIPGVPSIDAGIPAVSDDPAVVAPSAASRHVGDVVPTRNILAEAGPNLSVPSGPATARKRPRAAPRKTAARASSARPAAGGPPVRVRVSAVAVPARPVSARKPVVSAAAYQAATLGMTVVRHASIEVTDAGVFADEVPELWRVRAGSTELPLVAICFSMLEAVVLVQPKLQQGQLQSLSVWSDGFLA